MAVERVSTATPTVAILFTNAKTNYRALPNVEIYDRRRDARYFRGGMPVVAHPPCRAFSHYLRHQAKPEEHEKTLAYFALSCVRAYGGILEHPRLSTLFDECNIPKPGDPPDQLGYTIEIWQWWFGYPGGRKRTWLYCCGVHPNDMPPIPYRLWTPGDHGRFRRLSKQARSATQPDLCRWLVAVAAKAHLCDNASRRNATDAAEAAAWRIALSQPTDKTKRALAAKGYILAEEPWGYKMKLARIKKGMSQTDLAQHIGATQPQISQWEKRDKPPRPTLQLQKLKEILELDD